jgi:hypothetical protein
VALVVVRIPRACIGFAALTLPLASIAVAAAAPAEQHASAEVEQKAASNSGVNLAVSHAPGLNQVEQNASAGEGDAANGNTATNTLAANAGIASGDAGAGNTLSASAAQKVTPPPAPAVELDDTVDVAALDEEPVAEAPPVVQTMSVVLEQAAVANTGGNVSVGVAKGTNEVTQTAASTGPGNAANTNAATNNGTATSSVTTGDATASNSSTISITQEAASTP